MTGNYYSRVKKYKLSFFLVALFCVFIMLTLYIIDDSGVNIEEKSHDSNQFVKSEIDIKYPVISSNSENSYRISAEKIRKGSEDKYLMNQISGIYNLEGDQNITLSAKNCDMNNSQDYMKVNNDVKIGYEDYIMYTESMDIDLEKKQAHNNEIVHVIGQNGKVRANKFKTNEEFCEITLDGSVEAHFDIGDNN